jgi:hypothetical protein
MHLKSFTKHSFKIVITLSVIQALIICGLFWSIQNKKQVLGETINQIDLNNITFQPDKTLKFFYEPKIKTTKTVGNRWTTETSLNTINSDTLNERFDYDLNEPTDGVYRIITLGDSFTYGLYVNTSDNYPEQLEDQLNQQNSCSKIRKYEVINLGVEGYDIEYAVRRFKDRGQKYQPNLVIWFLKRDDFEQIADLVYSDAEQITKELQDKNELDGYYARGFYNPGFEIATHELSKKYGKQAIYLHQKAALNSLSTYFKKDLVLLTFADLDSEFKNILLDFKKNRPQTYLVDSLPKLNTSDIFPDTHPNKMGYAKIANQLIADLKTNNLLDCP